jgi:hypothetical protein
MEVAFRVLGKRILRFGLKSRLPRPGHCTSVPVKDRLAPARSSDEVLLHRILPKPGEIDVTLALPAETVSVASKVSRLSRDLHLAALLVAGYEVRYVPGEPSPASTVTPGGHG